MKGLTKDIKDTMVCINGSTDVMIYRHGIGKVLLLHLIGDIGYEPADLTVHPPPQNYRGWVHFFSYRCLVFYKKCPQRKACTFLSYSG